MIKPVEVFTDDGGKTAISDNIGEYKTRSSRFPFTHSIKTNSSHMGLGRCNYTFHATKPQSIAALSEIFQFTLKPE